MTPKYTVIPCGPAFAILNTDTGVTSRDMSKKLATDRVRWLNDVAYEEGSPLAELAQSMEVKAAS